MTLLPSLYQKAPSLETMTVVIFALNGDLTLNSDQDTLEMIKRHVKAKTQTILLDMKNIGFVDSAGLALLIQLCKFSMSLGMRLALCSISEQMNQLLLLTSTGSLFEVFDNQESFYHEWIQDFPADATLPPLDSLPVVEVTTE
jgi:anti-anti-sigma factor